MTKNIALHLSVMHAKFVPQVFPCHQAAVLLVTVNSLLQNAVRLAEKKKKRRLLLAPI